MCHDESPGRLWQPARAFAKGQAEYRGTVWRPANPIEGYFQDLGVTIF